MDIRSVDQSYRCGKLHSSTLIHFVANNYFRYFSMKEREREVMKAYKSCQYWRIFCIAIMAQCILVTSVISLSEELFNSAGLKIDTTAVRVCLLIFQGIKATFLVVVLFYIKELEAYIASALHYKGQSQCV